MITSPPPLRRACRPLLLPLFTRRPDRLTALVASFGLGDPGMVERIQRIVQAFLEGYNAMATAAEPTDVHGQLAHLPSFYRPFAYEGAAMGFGPWAWLSGRGYEAFEPVIVRGVSPGTLYQNYVGLGWWLATRFRRPAAMATVASRLDYRYRLLVYEGIGFRAGFLRSGNLRVTESFRGLGQEPERVCHQGFGRSLWFVHMDDPPAAAAAIDRLPASRQADCYSGLGLGCAYSWLDQAARVDEVGPVIPGRFRADFLQGVAFGWEARHRADPALFDDLMLQAGRGWPPRAADALAAVRAARLGLEHIGCRTDFYQHWRRSVRSVIAADL